VGRNTSWKKTHPLMPGEVGLDGDFHGSPGAQQMLLLPAAPHKARLQNKTGGRCLL